MSSEFDVIVIGAGHAGVEASLAASRMGMSTLVITSRLDRIGFMSCNPSIGGLGKGHMVREIDILGGAMASIADKTTIQFKRLNAKKGPAVRGSRSQCDKDLYSKEMGVVLTNTKNLKVLEAEAKSLVLINGHCKGVVLADGSQVLSKTVVITAGTFMRGVMHIGTQRIEGGRVGEEATVGLSDQLAEHGFDVIRLKTGTPPRLKKDSIHWEVLTQQFGDKRFTPFSFRSPKTLALPQIACHISHTNERTHEIIRKNLQLSPMFTGAIDGTGPRYCPSIEDKITRFADKESHQTFLEVEGLNTNQVYLQGISTSLPESIQLDFLRTIRGLENVEMIRPGYAVEYDCIEPTQIWPSLETRPIANLFLAGQINGTSGYEEAAGQGLVAGVNASCKVLERDPMILGRADAYIGVLVDDLVTKGTREPYRMFTSRAEHRLVLREDNNVERLFDISKKFSLLEEGAIRHLDRLIEARQKLHRALKSQRISPKEETLNKLSSIGTKPIIKQISLEDLLRRSEVNYSDLSVFGLDPELPDDVSEPVEVSVKYSGYIKRQNELIGIAKKMEKMSLPVDLNYQLIRGLSNEEVEKLNKIKPLSVAQAQRISGVNPSAIQSILVYLKLHKHVIDREVVGK